MQKTKAGSDEVPDQEPPGTTISLAAVEPRIRSSWNDWRWQMRNRIRSFTRLKDKLPGFEILAGMEESAGKFPLAITPYYTSLIQQFDDADPIFRMCVPQMSELYDPPCLKDDPLEEDEDMPVPGMVHRYPDRVLIIATTTCGTYCRHCTRKRTAGQKETSITANQLAAIVKYLTEHPEIHDVILSGGDPFTLGTRTLERILSAVRKVPSVDVIRVGTRTPVVLPMRITDSLVTTMRKFHPLYVNTHFNHPSELTPEAETACTRLADAGIPVGNQTVLLKGVNDDPLILERLFRGLVRIRVRPYYLFQCDLVRGVEHFRTPLTRGIEIMEYLRGRLSGLAIPTFVVDAPHGGGKVPVLPNYIVSSSPTHTVIRNFEGMLVSYPEPSFPLASSSPAPQPTSAPGVWELTSGSHTKIQPSKTVRHSRRCQRVPADR